MGLGHNGVQVDAGLADAVAPLPALFGLGGLGFAATGGEAGGLLLFVGCRRRVDLVGAQPVIDLLGAAGKGVDCFLGDRRKLPSVLCLSDLVAKLLDFLGKPRLLGSVGDFGEHHPVAECQSHPGPVPIEALGHIERQ